MKLSYLFEVLMLLRSFLPNLYTTDIYQIDIKVLKEKGIKGIITDLDNTLVAWDKPKATKSVEDWFQQLEDYNINVIIISNNNEDRVKKFYKPLKKKYDNTLVT